MNQNPRTPMRTSPNIPSESLEDAIYKAAISSSNRAMKRGNPLVTIPTTVAMYALFAAGVFMLAKPADKQKPTITTVTFHDSESALPNPPLPPPLPPPPPASAAPSRTDPTSLDPRQEGVPETVPQDLPNQDHSLGGVPGGVPGGILGGFLGDRGEGAVDGGLGGTGQVVDFDFSQVKIRYQPPVPPYPPLARIAKIQGTVIVEIVIGPDGVPTDAVAKEGPPQLRDYATHWAKSWRFEPALLNGAPQYARFRLTMPFRLK